MSELLQGTLRVEGGFIAFRSDKYKFLIKIDSITCIEHILESEQAHVIGDNSLNQFFQCTRQQFDKIMDDIIKITNP